MKTKSLILTLVFTNTLQTAMAQESSMAGGINSSGVMTAVAAGTNGADAARNMPRCPKSGRACVKAILGIAQMLANISQFANTFGTRDGLSPGTDWGIKIPDLDLGTLTPAEREYMDPMLDAIKTGRISDYLSAADALRDASKDDLEKLAALGYSMDMDKGTITTPTGTENFDSLASKFGDGDASSMADKIATAMGLKDQGSGPGGSKTAADLREDEEFNRSLASFDANNKNNVDKFLKDLDKGKLDSKLTGMSVNTKNGDAIGVAMGNLFKTIHVKYKSLDSKEEFK